MLEPIINCSAGLDVHKKVIVACVQNQQGEELFEETKEFSTFNSSLKELVEWLQLQQVEAIVMESTGIYWKRLYTLLDQRKLNILVVNARHVKQVPGRKTDVMDSQWLATLARYGLLTGSFIPPKDILELRLLSRYRMKLIGQLSGEKNRLHKLLDDAGVRLGCVVSDINGRSAKDIIRGLIDGKSIKELVQCVRGRLKQKIPDLELALDCPLGKRHRFLLQSLQLHIEDLEKHIQQLDDELMKSMLPYQKEWQLLQTIPGIDAISAAIIISIIGVNMARFDNMQKFCSWAGLCPGNNESAGKKKSARTRKGNQLLRQVMCQIANAAAKTNCQFKSKYQSLVIRRGHKRTIIALAHKILRVIYTVLLNQQHYYDPEINYEKMMVDKNAPRWIKMLDKYGYVKNNKP
jgi:transposase